MTKLISILCLLFAIAAHGGMGFNTQPIPGLVGWWTMNEGSGTASTADLSGFANTGFLTNSPAWTNGVVGSGLRLNGTNQLVASGTPTPVLPFSASAWVSFSVTNATQWVLSKTDFGANKRSWHFGWANSGVWNFGASTNGLTPSINYTWSYGLPTNVWLHLVFVYNDAAANKVNVFVNGAVLPAPTKVADTGGTPFDSGLSLFIGASLSSGAISSPLNGTIDDVRIYSRALTAEEVRMLYNGGAGTQR